MKQKKRLCGICINCLCAVCETKIKEIVFSTAVFPVKSKACHSPCGHKGAHAPKQ